MLRIHSPRGLPLALALCAVLAAVAAATTTAGYSSFDDRLHLEWDREIRRLGSAFAVNVSTPRQVVPSAGLPSQISLLPSNNCVGIAYFDGKLFMGWRSAPTHFASAETRMFIASSTDDGVTWQLEREFRLGADVREPHFLEMNGTFVFSFFMGGTDPMAFQPRALLRSFRSPLGAWSDAEEWGHPGEIAWQISTVNGVAYATSYSGNHYSDKPSEIRVYFNMSTDGVHWSPVYDYADGAAYVGGVSEVGYAFDADGNMWGVMRNEDGDASRWGSRVVHAARGLLGVWELSPGDLSDPWIYESPRMFRHGDDMYLVARRDIKGPYDWCRADKVCAALPFEFQKGMIMASYSERTHTTSLWRIDRSARTLVFVADLFGCGDTAFPSIVRQGPNKFLIANYSSPLDKCKDWSWLKGQTAPEGTQISFVTVEFDVASGAPIVSQRV